jgi:hypothetical protein
MANMYLVVAEITNLGRKSIGVPTFLDDIPQGVLTPLRKALVETMFNTVG